MTPEEKCRYDINGYMLVKNAITADQLSALEGVIDAWQEKAYEDFKEIPEGKNQEVRYNDIINEEPELVDLAANPVVLPYLTEMMDRPRLKSTWIAFKWRGGATGLHSNHTPTNTCNFYHYNGQIRHNLMNMMYAFADIEPGGGALQVIPGSHKANYPRQSGDDISDLLVELPMEAGDVLLFTHDIAHCSRNETDDVRRTVMYTYCPGVISNSYGGDTLNDDLHEKAEVGSWLKYLTRQPHGFLETYPQPETLPAVPTPS